MYDVPMYTITYVLEVTLLVKQGAVHPVSCRKCIVLQIVNILLLTKRTLPFVSKAI